MRKIHIFDQVLSLFPAAAEVSAGNLRRRGIVTQGSNDEQASKHDVSESAAPEVDPIISE